MEGNSTASTRDRSFLQTIIAASIHYRVFVILFTFVIIGWGLYAMRAIPLDALPDLSDVQVIVFTDYPGQAPQVVEDQVTYPLTTTMLSVPGARVVRGYSFFGFSFVYIIFEDGVDLYWARSRVLEYLNYVSKKLPAGVTPTLGPDATGVGWVYEYTVESDQHDLAQLRSIQDWFLRYELASVPGVAEVASIGGFVKQYQVEVDPNKLVAYGMSLSKIKHAIMRNNRDVGGKLVEMAETEFMVRGLGYITSIDDVKTIPLGVDQRGTPILVRDVANVHLGPELRRGILERDGVGEVVGGIIIMRYGENALQTINNVKKRLAALQDGLPEGVRIIPAYDRSNLIVRAIDTLKEKLIEVFIVVALICILFLLHLRSAFVALICLPVSIFIAFIAIYYQGINANIMSLGGIAIAIGVMVDAAVVMVENAHKHLARKRGTTPHWDIITESAMEVGPSLFFSLLILPISFLPIFTLEAQEGRLFKPLAYTNAYALAASALLALTLIPVLMGYSVRGKILSEERNPINRGLIALYRPLIARVLRFRKTIVVLALCALVATLFPLGQLGSEFMPPLNEGDLLYMPTTLPGISITKAKELLQQTDRIIKSFPEVHHVLGKAGRAETATDPAPLSMLETTITLKPEQEWRQGMTVKKLVAELDAAIQFPGVTNAWTMPIKTRLDMLSTGIKTPVGIKVAGKDLTVLEKIGEDIEAILRNVPGTLSVYSERVAGGNYFDYVIDREEAARYGLSVGDIQDVIMTAIGGMNITETVEGLERYPVNLRYPRELRDNIRDLERILIATPRGDHIPIAQVATLKITKGPPAIKSENARLNAWSYIDIKDIDVGTYVQTAQKAVQDSLNLPAGYSLTWSGQYEYMQRAQKRLQVVVPVTLLIILLFLYMNFGKITESLIVMLSIPFALVGGIWLIYLLDYNLSVAVGVGFIALAGLAAETGVIMLFYINSAYEERRRANRMQTLDDLYESVIEGTVARVRPIMMTTSTTVIGLLPILWSRGAGAQVMQRIASPMVGGLVSAAILTLIVIPAIFTIWKGWELQRDQRSRVQSDEKSARPAHRV
jgi:Cu(I)/Ag(I) efflux system membrane protein CusA/SilA